MNSDFKKIIIGLSILLIAFAMYNIYNALKK